MTSRFQFLLILLIFNQSEIEIACRFLFFDANVIQCMLLGLLEMFWRKWYSFSEVVFFIARFFLLRFRRNKNGVWNLSYKKMLNWFELQLIEQLIFKDRNWSSKAWVVSRHLKLYLCQKMAIMFYQKLNNKTTITTIRHEKWDTGKWLNLSNNFCY